MNTLTDSEREAARTNLEIDERLARSAQLGYLLDELATEVGRIRRIADAVPDDYASPARALELVAAVGRQNRLQGKAAEIVTLLGRIQDAAVLQARAHTASWAQIGQQTGEHANNIRQRFTS